MANTSPDDVAQLKQELAQFLLTEITSVQGAATFRQEVAGQVGTVIDQLFAERLTPALARMEQDYAQQIRQITDRIEPALRRLEETAPDGPSPATAQQLAEIATGLDELRQRLARVEDQGRSGRLGGAMAQPIRAKDPAGAEAAIVASPVAAAAPAWPRWVLWLLVILALLTTIGLANLYYERLAAPTPETTRASLPPPAPAVAAAPSPTAGAVTPPPQAVPTPPPTAVATPPSTTTPAAPSIKPQAPPAPTPQPHARNIPADFAIERGWLAAQPYAVEPRLARRAGTGGTATLRSLVCGASDVCTSDLLLNAASDAKQVIALQMLMAQIGDEFCTPRRTVAVTGQVSAGGLADLAAIAKCAAGVAHPCVETLNKVCPPDADSLQAGIASARTSLLRWALWKTGST